MNRFSIQVIIVLSLITGYIQSATGQEYSPNNIVKRLQNPDSLTGARVNIFQDKRVSTMISNMHTASGPRQTASGYRVQVFSSNAQRTAKVDAFRIEKEIRDVFPETGVYINYLSPFWKVRVGDFVSHEAAQQFRRELTDAFPQLKPETYIVREQIYIAGSKE